MTDMDGYPVLRDPFTKSFVYAEQDGKGGLQPSQFLVTRLHNSNDNNTDSPIYRPRQLQSPFKKQQQQQQQKRHLRPSKNHCRDEFCNDYASRSQQRLADQRLRKSQIYEQSKTIMKEFMADAYNGFS
jgi:hypothetical protein